MTGATLFYLRHSARNRFVSMLKKAKRPKYAIGLLFAIGYIVVFVILPLVGASIGAEEVSEKTAATRHIASVGIVTSLLIFGVFATIRSGGFQCGLPMLKAELLFLLGAPLSRRKLVVFFIWKQQLGLLLGSVFLSAMGVLIADATFVVAWPLTFLVLNLLIGLMIVTRFLTTALQNRGQSEIVTRAPFRFLALGLLAAMALAYRPYEGGPPWEYVQAVLAAQPLATLLWPFVAATEAALSPTLLPALPAAGVLLGLCVILYALGLAAPPPFEEASLLLSERIEAFKAEGWAGYKRATQRAQAGGKAKTKKESYAAPFKLAPLGSPVMALAWKNLIGLGRINTPRNFVLALITVTLLGVGASQLFPVGSPVPQVTAGILAYGALITIMITIQQRRHDLRLDIPQFPNLRAYPLTARQVLHGEVLSMAVVISAYTIVSLTACVSVLAGVGTAEEWFPLTWHVRASLLLGASAFGVGVVYFLVATSNILTLVWPGWSQIGHKPKVGIAQMGSNMLGMFLRMTVLGAGLIAPVTLAVLVTLAVALPTGAWALPYAAIPAGLVAGVTLVAEGLLALRLAEPVYDRFDLSLEYR